MSENSVKQIAVKFLSVNILLMISFLWYLPQVYVTIKLTVSKLVPKASRSYCMFQKLKGVG